MSDPDRPMFQRGFPTDWRIRPANMVQFDWQAHTRNMIHLWLPEGVGNPDGSLLFILSEEADFTFERLGEEHWAHTFEKPGSFGLRGECRAIADGVSMSLQITNLSDQRWESVAPGVCVQLAAAPDFADTTLQRTFTVSNDELVPMQQPQRTGPTHHYGCSSPATENFIAVNSDPPGYVLAQWWEGGPVSVGGNCHPSMACIHSPPALGAIEPGESATCVGGLYFMPGDVGAALERYRADVAAL